MSPCLLGAEGQARLQVPSSAAMPASPCLRARSEDVCPCPGVRGIQRRGQEASRAPVAWPAGRSGLSSRGGQGSLKSWLLRGLSPLCSSGGSIQCWWPLQRTVAFSDGLQWQMMPKPQRRPTCSHCHLSVHQPRQPSSLLHCQETPREASFQVTQETQGATSGTLSVSPGGLVPEMPRLGVPCPMLVGRLALLGAPRWWPPCTGYMRPPGRLHSKGCGRPHAPREQACMLRSRHW